MVLFVQPFGLSEAGGGARILRTLLENAPKKWLSVAATPYPTPSLKIGREMQLRPRLHFGRLERTRASHLFERLDQWATTRLYIKLDKIIKINNIKSVHAVAHRCWDTIAAFRAAKKNKVPFLLSVHDDPRYCIRDHPLIHHLLPKVAECWKEANARFVISEELGQELCRRWGVRDYVIITDGLTKIEERPLDRLDDGLSVYFMGLMHISYEKNILAIQEALHEIHMIYPHKRISLTLRCGSMRQTAVVRPELLRILPFGDESDIKNDLNSADLLYQPLSFETAHDAMSRYSLSTKMITYLGSGVPILFHGPSDSAAGRLLRLNRAAFICNSAESKELEAMLLRSQIIERKQVAASALELARRQFRIEEVRKRFWKNFDVG